jgi:hypothetical protein
MFKSTNGFTVQPPMGDSGPYTVTAGERPSEADPTTFQWLVDTLKDECSCAAIQGISCDHKQAVDEYVEHATKEELGHSPGEPTAKPAQEHRPKYERRQVGMTDTKPARPMWVTDVTCSCGWHREDLTTKDNAKKAWRTHADRPTPEKEEPGQLYDNREDWLHAAKLLWWERFGLFDVAYPQEVRVGVGFTYGRKKTTRGECWVKEASRDKTWEIIISNREDDPAEVFATLGHELIHTCAPGAQHGKGFSTKARAVGFRQAYVDSANQTDELKQWIGEQLAKLGRYPHAALEPTVRREGGPPKQTNRWLKYHCSVDGCGWIIRSPKPGFAGLCISPMHYDAAGQEGIVGVMLPGFEVEPEPPDDPTIAGVD